MRSRLGPLASKEARRLDSHTRTARTDLDARRLSLCGENIIIMPTACRTYHLTPNAQHDPTPVWSAAPAPLYLVVDLLSHYTRSAGRPRASPQSERVAASGLLGAVPSGGSSELSSGLERRPRRLPSPSSARPDAHTLHPPIHIYMAHALSPLRHYPDQKGGACACCRSPNRPRLLWRAAP